MHKFVIRTLILNTVCTVSLISQLIIERTVEPVFAKFALHHKTRTWLSTGAIQSFVRIARCLSDVLRAQFTHLGQLQCDHFAICLVLNKYKEYMRILYNQCINIYIRILVITD